MGLRASVHLLLHIIVPGLVAWLFARQRPSAGMPASRASVSSALPAGTAWRAWLVMLMAWVIDLDHLLADPIYAPDRCSIGFHPLHTTPAIVLYGALLIPRPTRWLGIGLLIHVGLDLIDCVWMRHG